MYYTKLSVFFGSLLVIISFSFADGKGKKGADFLRLNPDIKNEELRLELENLKNEFDLERQKIRDYYDREIKLLKEEQRREIKTIKEEFGNQRETLLQKYDIDRKSETNSPRRTVSTDSKTKPEKGINKNLSPRKPK